MNAIWEDRKAEDAAYPNGFVLLDQYDAEPFGRPDATSVDIAGGS